MISNTDKTIKSIELNITSNGKKTILNIVKVAQNTSGKSIIEGDKKLSDSLDHSTPLSRGGSNNYENLGVAHRGCNSQKNTMTLEEWFKHKNGNSRT